MKALLVFVLASISLTKSSSAKDSLVSSSKHSTVKQIKGIQEMFGYFRAHRQGKGISLNWSITSPINIAGFTIERSYDGDFYDVINQMNRGAALKFSWKDDFVFPGLIFYRIGCVMTDGSVQYSSIESVRIVKH